MLRQHAVLMFIYAVATAAFFALRRAGERRERLRSFAIIFSSLFFGGIALGWVMYAFPLGR
jgi:hypothetical protein